MHDAGCADLRYPGVDGDYTLLVLACAGYFGDICHDAGDLDVRCAFLVCMLSSR